MTYPNYTPDFVPLRQTPQPVQPITRALIRKGLRASELDGESQLYRGEDSENDCSSRGSEDGLPSVDAGLVPPDIATRLSMVIEEEQSRVDWSPEYRVERSTLDREIILDEDRAILNRISKGEGPRPYDYEDILAPLRVAGASKDSTSTAPLPSEESYDDQLRILFAWNRKVASIPNVDRERAILYDALEERCEMIAQVERGHRSRGALGAQSSRLRKALRQFRPEIATFEHRSSFSLLVMIVAHFRVAQPDVDLELKDKMIEVIFRDLRLMLRTEKQYDVRDRQLEARLQRAYESGNGAVASFLCKEKEELAQQERTTCTEETLDRLKIARRGVQQQKLAELQDLAMAQAGLKWIAHDKLPIPHSLLQKSLDNEEQTKCMHEHLDNAIAACDAGRANEASMVDLAYGCHEQSRGLVTKDIQGISHQEGRRMDGPETYREMMRVVDNEKAMSQIPGVVTVHMTKMNESLSRALDVVREQLREFDGWEGALIDEDTEADLAWISR